ncbi:hypothetical protein C2S52_014150 [Perilla frutescens var. hirtella]|nr:hypothetical protein C2S52_014150 [Perilla frutescens var. hirtella]
MGDGVGAGALTFLLKEVKDVVIWYKDLIGGAEIEFQLLCDELRLMKAFLAGAADKYKKDELFRELERQIREVVYDVEDTIAGCLAAVKARNSISRHLDVSPAREVKSLREHKVKPMFDKLKIDFAALETAQGGIMDEPRIKVKKDQSIRQDKVVGFEYEEQTIIGYLLDRKEELDVISIIGMPGLGKTTLAWKIYQNESISSQFPIRIWIHVSQRFNSRDVFLTILRRFSNQDMSILSDEDLIQTVRKCLEKETFMLVLDDVWSVDDWKVIQSVLSDNNGNGKVLITSREEFVGTRANVRRKPHKLRFLNETESWELLQLEVFGNLEDCPEELKGIGANIASQCDGVPLTIVVLGGILVEQSEKKRPKGVVKTEWNKVSKNVNPFLQGDKEKRILDVVKLSYDRLPDELRECFVYMGVFPEEHEIPTWTLTRLWIAEGFVQPKEGKSLEQIAEENLDDLISRNLLMVDRINPIGEVKVCQVHDMIRLFCKYKAMEQNMFQEIKTSKGVLDPPVSEVQKFHRLCFHSDLSKFLHAKPKGSHVRSFLCFYKEPVNLDPKYISTIPEAFNLLRVLDSQSIKFHEFPTRVTKLIHLRYITLYVDLLDVLPESLSLLWNLQTLVVETKSRSITMKANIWKMYRLRHVKTKAGIVLDEKWKGEAGENLQTMNRLSPESCTKEMCRRASNLKTLGIRGNLVTLFRAMSMENLGRLEKLKLLNDLPYESAFDQDRLNNLPQPTCFPPYLKRLTLSNTSLNWKHMSVLAKIDTLEVLKLKDNAFTGVSWSAVGSGFRNLQSLLIINADLVVWEASHNHFPSLGCLVLKSCLKLQEIPIVLAKNLEILEIERLRKSAVDSAKRIEAKKAQAQEQRKGKWMAQFKLSIGHGCEQSTNHVIGPKI